MLRATKAFLAMSEVPNNDSESLPQEDSASNSHQEISSERPLECSECKKPVDVYYTEIIGSNKTSTCMCKDCPILHQRLHGSLSQETTSATPTDSHAGLCCGNCSLTLEAVRTGNPLGCEECYEVFSDVIIMEMLAANKISQRLQPETTKKSIPIHVGRAPGESTKVNPSLRLVALNEALNETLAREDYEQAAWIRDQIKEIQESKDERE